MAQSFSDYDIDYSDLEKELEHVGSYFVKEFKVPSAIHERKKSSRQQHEIETTQKKKQDEIEAVDDGKELELEVNGKRAAILAYGMSLSSDVNMTTCYKHCQHFFHRYSEIHMRVLLCYWIMAGFLEAAPSVAQAMTNATAVLALINTKWGIFQTTWPEILCLEAAPSKPIECRHKGFCVLGNLGFVDLIDLSDDQLPYAATFNPSTQNLKSFLEDESTKYLTLLLIRGCQLFPLGKYLFPANFENLTILEISGSCLTFFPREAMSKLTRLRCLNLSQLPIEYLPHDSFHKLTQLRWLIIRGCSKLRSLPSIDHLTKLEVLDLSHCPRLQHLVFLDIIYPHLVMLDLSYTPVVYGFRELSTPNLTHLSLRGLKFRHLFLQVPNLLNLQVLDLSECEHLVSLSLLTNVPDLEQLNLSGCTCVTQLEQGLFDQMSCLLNLDLSWTKLKNLPSFASHTSLRRLSLRGLELDSIETLASLSISLVELDLMGLKIGSSQELKIDFLKSLGNLQILNLSNTSVANLPDMSKLVSLKELLLADCQYFRVIPSLLALKNLETLDLSLPHDCSFDNRQLESEAEGQGALSFSPIPVSLRKLVLTNRFGVQKILPKTMLENLEVLDLRGTDVIDWDSKLAAQQPQERIHKPVEIHIIRVKPRDLRLIDSDRFGDATMELGALISDIQKNLNSAKDTINLQTDNKGFKMHIEMICTNLIYIQKNIDRLKSYQYGKSRAGLLHEFMDAATYLPRADHLQFNFANLKKLHRLVLKLKLLIPLKETNDSKALGLSEKKNKPLFARSKNKENVVDIIEEMKGMEFDLLPSYQSLSDVQKHCLLCFSIFPYEEEGDKNTSILRSLVIKKTVLIYWWAGEGFIDPLSDMGMDEANEQVPATKRLEKPKPIEEIGKHIMEVFVEKKFIEPVIKKGRESGSYYMHPFVHSFVIEQAKAERFFDIDQETRNLTPHFNHSWRACLLKPQDKFPSSCELWARHVNSSKVLASFEHVKTLFNVNEPLIDIRREWFSKMKNLHVLRLGSWGSEDTDLIETEDQKFLEDLKRMKQLRLLSLQGLPTIMKLPNSVCRHLSNLIILDLKECSYLEELPPDIGSLKSLTHLDISNCPLLTKLPKGIKFLSKLEVLRGLVITGQHVARGSQDRNASTLTLRWCIIQDLFRYKKNEACTLNDVLKLERLRELSLVVKISMFPDDEELKVLKAMKQLRKLKILWERSICTEALQDCHPRQNDRQQTEEGEHLDNIEELALWCFPYETAPHWLNPSELKNLKSLHIVGGKLKELQGAISENKWNVTTLRFKYLHNLNIRWSELKTMFPQLMYLEKHQCSQLVDFPYFDDGVWRSAS